KGIQSERHNNSFLSSPQKYVREGMLARLAFAAIVATVAVDIGSLFHGFTRGTAVFASGCFASADGMGTFFCWNRGHVFLLIRSRSFRVWLDDRLFERALLCRSEHIIC